MNLIYFDNVNSGFTNTVVGTVHADIAPTGSQIAGVNTNQLTPGFNFVSSKLPIAGGLESVLGFTNVYNASLGYGPLDGDQIYIPNIVGGQFKGYKITTIDSTESTGYGDQYDTPNHAQPEPVIPVGGGFIFNNVNSTTVWVQSL